MALKIKLNRAGVRSSLRAPGVSADLRKRAQRVAKAAGEGFEIVEAGGANRARYLVVAGTFEAMRGETKDRRLTRAVDAAR